MAVLTFSEDDDFYDRLDQAIKNEEPVSIEFRKEKPDKKSDLWPRLRRCENWEVVENELRRIESGETSTLRGMIATKFVTGLTGGEIALVAFIASLIAGLIFYGIYKDRKIKLHVDKEPPSMKLEIA